MCAGAVGADVCAGTRGNDGGAPAPAVMAVLAVTPASNPAMVVLQPVGDIGTSARRESAPPPPPVSARGGLLQAVLERFRGGVSAEVATVESNRIELPGPGPLQSAASSNAAHSENPGSLDSFA